MATIHGEDKIALISGFTRRVRGIIQRVGSHRRKGRPGSAVGDTGPSLSRPGVPPVKRGARALNAEEIKATKDVDNNLRAAKEINENARYEIKSRAQAQNKNNWRREGDTGLGDPESSTRGARALNAEEIKATRAVPEDRNVRNWSQNVRENAWKSAGVKDFAKEVGRMAKATKGGNRVAQGGTRGRLTQKYPSAIAAAGSGIGKGAGHVGAAGARAAESIKEGARVAKGIGQLGKEVGQVAGQEAKRKIKNLTPEQLDRAKRHIPIAAVGAGGVAAYAQKKKRDAERKKNSLTARVKRKLQQTRERFV